MYLIMCLGCTCLGSYGVFACAALCERHLAWCICRSVTACVRRHAGSGASHFSRQARDHSQIARYPPCPSESKGPSPPRRATKLVGSYMGDAAILAEQKRVSHDLPRPRAISPDLERSPSTSNDLPRSPTTSSDLARSPPISSDLPRSRAISPDLERSPEISSNLPRSPAISINLDRPPPT